MYWRITPTVAGDSGKYTYEHNASYGIPPQRNVSEPWPVDWHLCKERPPIECLLYKIKRFRRIAIRYYKLNASVLSFVYPAAISIHWFRKTFSFPNKS